LKQNNKDIPAYIISASPLELAPNKLSEFINDGNAMFIVKDFANMDRILRPAIESARIKAGIIVKEKEINSPIRNKPNKQSDPFIIWKGRLTHKLNNVIFGLVVYSNGMLSGAMNDKEDFIPLCDSYEHCKSIIEKFREFAKEFRNRPKGDIKSLPKDLRDDKDAIDAITKISAMGDNEYNKISRSVAAIVILYEPILDKLHEHISLFKQNKDKSTLATIESLAYKLKYINLALVMEPGNEEMRMALKTIEYILDNL
jgi:hypothetical protein